MFRRKKSVRHAPLNTNPSPSAQTAAAQAFRASQNPTPSLSSSAAAAALRSHTPPPTAVKDVQTKRMLQRKQSTSSVGSSKASAHADGKNEGLRRTRSSCSMANRTFRDQLPPRAGSAASNPIEVTPVPPVPRGYTASPTPQTMAGSTELLSYQGAAAPGGRRPRSVSNSSLGLSDLERRGSRNSVNFSYPMHRPNSPRLSIASADSPRRRRASSPRIQQLFSEQAPGSTRRALSEFRPPQVDQGTQVAEGSFGKTSTTPPLSAIESDIITRKPQTDKIAGQTATKSPPSALVGEIMTDGHGDIHRPLPSPTLTRRPSIVIELQEEGEDDHPYERPVHHTALDTTDKQPRPASPSLVASEKPPTSKPEPSPPSQQRSNNRHDVPQPHSQGPAALPPQIIPHLRPHSPSPSRLTRFSAQLEVPESEEHLHNPPPRSLSPAKPALKSMLRSPPERLSYQPGNASSETSEGTSLVSDDGSRAESRKKQAKVSFEDETEVIGHGNSSPPSPESLISSGPRAYVLSRSLNGGHVRPNTRGDDSNEFDQFFTPRPALPSFGSIRGRKPSRTRDIETDSKPATEIISSSSDHAIGEIISTSSKNIEPNLPLPPVVTSLEGTGYTSSSEDSFSDEGADLRYFPPRLDSRNVSAARSIPDQTAQTGTSQSHQTETANRLLPTPTIFIQPATPAMEEKAYCEESSPQIPKVESQPIQEETNPNFSTPEGNLPDQEQKDNDSDSGNSVYSDAYEDITDMDLNGFGSIDAIVDRSVNLTPEPQHFSTVHSLPQESEQRDMVSELRDTKGLPPVVEAAQGSQSQSTAQYQPPSAYPSPEAPENYEKHSDALSAPDSFQPPEKPLFEECPRNSPTTAASYASTNASPPGQFDCHSPTLRPIPESNEASDKKLINTNTKVTPVHRPRRTVSNASDSSSSFKRTRRSRPTGRYTLRRTMRVASPNNSMEVLSDGGLPSRAFDYSLNHRPFSSNDSRPTMMRTTLRPPPTPASRFSALTGLGKSTKASRFSGKPRRARPGQGFKSRYEDSSDEDIETINLRPVRGIPRGRHEVEGDSTDLDDSSEYETTRHVLRRKKSDKSNRKSLKDPAVAAALAKLMATKDTENTTTVTASHDQPIDLNGKNKSGLLGRLQLPKPKPRRRDSMTKSPEPESALRKDTSQRRPKLELDPSKNALSPPHHHYSRSTTTITVNGRVLEPSGDDWHSISPKLQKRLSKRVPQPVADSWPLRSNGHTAISLPSSPSAVEKTGPALLTMQAISNGKDTHARPRTSDCVTRPNNTRHANETPTPSSPLSPLSPARSQRPAWTSRFLPSRGGTDDTSVTSAISDVHLSPSRMDTPQREKRGRFPSLRRVFGIA
ncbi:hypothetical protein MferCBS31731_000300 [Microsporum ferrugineum]